MRLRWLRSQIRGGLTHEAARVHTHQPPRNRATNARRSSAVAVCGLLIATTFAAGLDRNRAGATTTHRNQLANASFEHSLVPWGGTRLERKRFRSAPGGRYVLRAAAA